MKYTLFMGINKNWRVLLCPYLWLDLEVALACIQPQPQHQLQLQLELHLQLQISATARIKWKTLVTVWVWPGLQLWWTLNLSPHSHWDGNLSYFLCSHRERSKFDYTLSLLPWFIPLRSEVYRLPNSLTGNLWIQEWITRDGSSVPTRSIRVCNSVYVRLSL